jgi:hypothetical protein
VFLRAVSCPTTTTCFAAGDNGILAGTVSPAIGVWSWTPQTSPPYHNNFVYYESISCLPASGLSSFSCEAGGFDAAGDGVIVTGPGTWTVEAVLDSDIRALSCTGSVGGFLQNSNFECVAGGGSDTILTKRIVSRVLGTGVLTPSDGSSGAGKSTEFTLTWTVPSPQVWRDLQNVDLKLTDDEGAVGLWARFIPGNPTSIFALLDGNGNIVSEGPPGTSGVLESPVATLDLSRSSFVGTGPTGPSVTVNFAVAFKVVDAGNGVSQNAAHKYDIEISAADVNGVAQTPQSVGSWAVRPNH